MQPPVARHARAGELFGDQAEVWGAAPRRRQVSIRVGGCGWRAETLAIQLASGLLADLLAILERERQPRGVSAHNAGEPDVGQLGKLPTVEAAHASYPGQPCKNELADVGLGSRLRAVETAPVANVGVHRRDGGDGNRLAADGEDHPRRRRGVAGSTVRCKAQRLQDRLAVSFDAEDAT